MSKGASSGDDSDVPSGPYPCTVDEAVERIKATLDASDLEAIAAMNEEELISLHFGLGMYIRNEFGLWAGSQFDPSGPYRPGELAFMHPDDVSMVIIEALWRDLRKDKAAEGGSAGWAQPHRSGAAVGQMACSGEQPPTPPAVADPADAYRGRCEA